MSGVTVFGAGCCNTVNCLEIMTKSIDILGIAIATFALKRLYTCFGASGSLCDLLTVFVGVCGLDVVAADSQIFF